MKLVSGRDFARILERRGWTLLRISGSHHIFSRNGVEEIINIQPKGNKAKPYQVKQVRMLIFKYKLNSDGK